MGGAGGEAATNGRPFVERRDFGLVASVTAMDLRPFDELSFN